jgi:hypothetical protein
MPSGRKFITHEFDEAIAIQRAIVETERVLRESHPVAKVKRRLKADLRSDRRHLQQLVTFGHAYGADGKREDVADALATLAERVTAKAGAAAGAAASDAASEAYEVHAVLLALKRKQQDSANGLIAIARELGERDLRVAVTAMKREMKRGADVLAKQLAAFALQIALT